MIEVGSAILGLIVLLPRPEYLLLDNIAVAPRRQGSELGGQLLAFAGGSDAARLPRDPPLYPPDDDRESAPLRRHRLPGTRRGTEAGYERVFMCKRLAD